MFEFVRQHYTVKTLAPISCHAFISSLEEFHSGDKASSYINFNDWCNY